MMKVLLKLIKKRHLSLSILESPFHTLEAWNQKLKKKPIIMNGYAPFIVMIGSADLIRSSPSSSVLHKIML
jgi:hypothetical protein